MLISKDPDDSYASLDLVDIKHRRHSISTMPSPPTSPDSKRLVAAGYDKIAANYLAWAHSRPKSMSHRLELLERLYAPLSPVQSDGTEQGESHRGLDILELGCGAGEPITLALAANPAVSSVIANDISSTQLQMLGDRLAAIEAQGEPSAPKVELVHKDMMELDFEADSLDAVLAFYSVIHLPQAEQTELISRARRWLRAGHGCLLACFGAKETPGVTNDDWLGMKSFWSSHGVDKSLEIVQSRGFEVIHQELADDPEDAPFLWVIARKVSA